MKKYTESEVKIESVLPEDQFRGLEMVSIAEEVRQSGENQVWNIGVGGSISAIPLIHKGVVYFGCCDMNFYALDAETGGENWRFPTQGPIVGGNHPTIHKNTIYFCSQDGNLYALGMDGKEKWRFNAEDKMSNTPAVYKDVIYFGTRTGKFFALDLEGNVKWNFKISDSVLSPIVWKGRIFFSSHDRNVYCLGLDGKLIWRFPLPDEAGHNPAMDEDRLYVACRNGTLYAISMKGELLWKFHTNGHVYSVPLIYKGRVHFSSWDQNFYCLDAKTGKEIWKFRTNHINFCEPVLWNETIYFCSVDNHVYALNLDGKLKWKFEANGPVPGNCNVSDGKLYFGSWSCLFYCLDAETGKELWRFKTSLSTPAPVDVKSSSTKKTVELILPAEEVGEEERYKPHASGEEARSEYSVKSDYMEKTQSKYTKRRKIKSMSSGWDDD